MIFRLLRPAFGNPAGTVVYQPRFYDWGCASKDTRFHGKPYVSVTLDPEGEPPSFTVPEADLEPLTGARAG